MDLCMESQTQGHISGVPGLGKWRQKGHEFKVISRYIVNSRPA